MSQVRWPVFGLSSVTAPSNDLNGYLTGFFAPVRGGPPAQLNAAEQRAFYAEHAPDGIDLDALVPLGPTYALKGQFTPKEFGRRLTVEMWLYPDGSRILELSTKAAPAEAFQVAAEARAYLSGLGIDLAGAQEPKTRAALEFYAAELNE